MIQLFDTSRTYVAIILHVCYVFITCVCGFVTGALFLVYYNVIYKFIYKHHTAMHIV